MEWAVANQLQEQGELEFVYPVFLGDPDSAATDGCKTFEARNGGSDKLVTADQACVEEALGAPAGSFATLTSRQTVAAVNQNQVCAAMSPTSNNS